MTDELLLWDDNPSRVDLLGFDAIAGPIREALTRHRLDPVCVGIFGPWGCGKTTVLRLIAEGLGVDESIIAVFTEPWAYDPATDPKATLIGEVLTALHGELERTSTLTESVRTRIAALAKRVRWSRAIKLAARTALTAQLPKLEDLEALFGDETTITEPTVQGFRDDFASLLADEALKGISRVVVVVDDLDRCLPETVIDTLEAIKLFLSVPKMAFLVAADEAPVRHAIATRYGESDEAQRLASRYLDKIVQIPVDVPVLGRADVEAYLAQLLLQERVDPETFPLITEHCSTRRATGETNLLDGLDVGVDVEADLTLAARLAPVLYEELEGNPRHLKRFLNAYWIRTRVAAARGITADPATVAKLMVLERLYRDDFQTVLQWLAADQLDANLAELESGEGEHSDQLLRWGALDPKLTGRSEVARYLVLAAALTGTTISDTAVPGHLRDIAGALTSPRDREWAQARKAAPDLDVADRATLARLLADAIRLQPTRQDRLAESLKAVIADDGVVEASALPGLRRLRHGDLAAALPITLAPPGSVPSTALRELLQEWGSSPDAPDDVRNAVQLIMSKAAG